ncbi:MAG: hypothetical protein ACFB5Z_00380 [Elainellaceae cyanobacterium]
MPVSEDATLWKRSPHRCQIGGNPDEQCLRLISGSPSTQGLSATAGRSDRRPVRIMARSARLATYLKRLHDPIHSDF